jgi:hypothetical protein
MTVPTAVFAATAEPAIAPKRAGQHVHKGEPAWHHADETVGEADQPPAHAASPHDDAAQYIERYSEQGKAVQPASHALRERRERRQRVDGEEQRRERRKADSESHGHAEHEQQGKECDQQQISEHSGVARVVPDNGRRLGERGQCRD